jgi:hypothetical protein
MGKRSNRKSDVNVDAFRVVQQSTSSQGTPEKVHALLEDLEETKRKPVKNPAAVALGRLGGLKGGKARAKSLTPEQKSEIAKAAAQARWNREKR